MAHPLHTIVGKEFEKFFNPKRNYKLLLDPACGGKQNIPFFFDKTKPKRAVWLTNVDIMVAEEKTKKVKLVCEIDESNVKPGHIFGKLLTLISSRICILNDKKEYYFDDKLIFIQVLSTEKLKTNSHKIKQWTNIETSIRNNLKVFDKFKSVEYHVLKGDSNSFSDSYRLHGILSKL